MTTWKENKGSRVCPICGKRRRCKLSPDGTAAMCFRISEGAYRDCKGVCWLHKIGESRGGPMPQSPEPIHPHVSWDKLLESYSRFDRKRLDDHAESLGLHSQNLTSLQIGYAGNGTWTFPMRDDAKRIIGLRTRKDDGKKAAFPGSVNGLFIPREFDDESIVAVAEGPTDSAALLKIGIMNIGRASCTTGNRFLVKLLAERSVIIVSDNGEPGIKGADELGYDLEQVGCKIRIVKPPREFKDVREWVRRGACSADII